MSEKMFLNLLLLYGILSQGIIETFADENIKASTGILNRQKRVISTIPGEDQRIFIHDIPYIVRIKQHTRIICVGTILSTHVVITISTCVEYSPWMYHVLSGASRSDLATTRNVTNIRKKYGDHANRASDGIALLAINPPFTNGAANLRIELHTGPLLPGTLGTVSGWGYNCRTADHGTVNSRHLRSIQVPIMSHQECVNIYRPHNIQISDEDICTFHPERHCGHSDRGAPLVIDDYLVGIHLWTGPARDQFNSEFPDVFVILQHLTYNQWITSNIHNIEAQFNHHN